MKKNVLAIVAAAVILLTVLTFAGPLQAAAEGSKSNDNICYYLTVLHNNDGESELLPAAVLDEDGNQIGTQGGVAHFATVRIKAEQEARRARIGSIGSLSPQELLWQVKEALIKRGVIFVSSGDNFLASPAFTASVADGVFYDAMALDMLRYDAIDLGNHDFDFGPETLAQFISEGFRRPGMPPYLSSNLDFSGEPSLQSLVDNGVIAKSTVVVDTGEKIGIIGATTENLPFISSPRDVIVNAVLPAVQAQVENLEAKGIDKIVLISHLQDVDGDIALAAQLKGVDVMIAGGGDELLANPDDLLLPSDSEDDIFGPYPMIAVDAEGKEVPVVTTSGQYGYLGMLTVGFDCAGNVVRVDEDRSRPIRVVSKEFSDGVLPDRKFQKEIEAPIGDVCGRIGR